MHNSLIQNTPEWEEMRKNKIGASDAPIIMEVSPWKTPYQLWQEKLSLSQNKTNSAMSRGHTLEEKARECFIDTTGILISPMVKFHPNHQWMIASLDGVDVSGDQIVEIKCPGQEDHAIALSGSVPEKYFPQLQHQMEVCQVEMAYYFSFDGSKGVAVKVYRDDKYIKNLINKEKEFWECVQELVAPKLTSRDYTERTEGEWLSLTSELNAIMLLKEREEEIRKRLIELSGGVNSCGGGIKVSKICKKGNVDYSKIPELNNVDLEQYRKPSTEYWKIIQEKE